MYVQWKGLAPLNDPYESAKPEILDGAVTLDTNNIARPLTRLPVNILVVYVLAAFIYSKRPERPSLGVDLRPILGVATPFILGV